MVVGISAWRDGLFLAAVDAWVDQGWRRQAHLEGDPCARCRFRVGWRARIVIELGFRSRRFPGHASGGSLIHAISLIDFEIRERFHVAIWSPNAHASNRFGVAEPKVKPLARLRLKSFSGPQGFRQDLGLAANIG